MSGPALVLRAAAAAALLVPWGAAAHEVVREVRPGGAVAVRFALAGGEPLAYAEAEVYSPADERVPHQKGRTDRGGWLAFVPDRAGTWRVKVADASGHGLEAAVEVGPEGVVSAAPPPGGAAAWVLRPLAGLAAVAVFFGALVAVRRRGGSRR